MKLTTKVSSQDIDNWSDLKPGEYIFLVNTSDQPCAIIFKCPGCMEPIHIATKTHKEEPGWSIDFEKLTASPSILHKRNDKGCGWHGYLVEGVLTPC